MILPALAQIPAATPTQLGEWLIPAAAIMGIIVLAKKLFIRHPPVEAEFVSWSDFEKFKDQMTDRNDEIKLEIQRSIKDLDAKAEERASAIHSRINRVSEETAQLVARVEILLTRDRS